MNTQKVDKTQNNRQQEIEKLINADFDKYDAVFKLKFLK